MVRPLCPLTNSLCGCFCLGSCPFVCLVCCSLTKRKSGWGICGSSGWFVWFLVCCDLPAFPDLLGLCTNDVFTAYAHVRTEPQCDIGHTRGKKTVDKPHEAENKHQKSECVPASSEGQRSHTVTTNRAQLQTLFMLCRQRGTPTADGLTSRPSPTSTRLPVPSNGPTAQHGIPMPWLHAPGYIASSVS